MEQTQQLEAPAHYSPNQLVTYKVIDGSNVTYNTDKVTTIEYELDGARRTRDKLNALQNKVNSIIDMLSADNYYSDDHDKDSILNDLCETLGHNPKKTIEFTAQVTVTGTVDIELSEINDFDLSNFLADALTVDSWNGDTVIDNFEIDSVDEN